MGYPWPKHTYLKMLLTDHVTHPFNVLLLQSQDCLFFLFYFFKCSHTSLLNNSKVSNEEINEGNDGLHHLNRNKSHLLQIPARVTHNQLAMFSHLTHILQN